MSAQRRSNSAPVPHMLEAGIISVISDSGGECTRSEQCKHFGSESEQLACSPDDYSTIDGGQRMNLNATQYIHVHASCGEASTRGGMVAGSLAVTGINLETTKAGTLESKKVQTNLLTVLLGQRLDQKKGGRARAASSPWVSTHEETH